MCTPDIPGIVLERSYMLLPEDGFQTHILQLPVQADRSPEARAFVRHHATAWGFAEPHISDITLAVGEAVANALEHAPPHPDHRDPKVLVCLSWNGETLGVRIRDYGPGFDPAVIRSQVPPALTAERGRGLALMEKLMDRVEHIRHSDGMEVYMEKQLPVQNAETILLPHCETTREVA